MKLLALHEQRYIFKNAPDQIQFAFVPSLLERIRVSQPWPNDRKIIVTMKVSIEPDFLFESKRTVGSTPKLQHQWLFFENGASK